ncbi:uncharacterized protein JN550_000351 [Neoarthrinium moseri]|uniref:uncharacterized protein n=1 Tax=Neoarthrinium moseri TaxID=1658444 RepID=UPI001FDB56FC|nr:uncharacterized protein JN550_000351 [Neoarthrinium moseri]KAI1878169.1 hypothetical protein JN550_000351 [Neoarthrinium moseri]
MRWDGASRSSRAWDNLRRDPELWYRDGDCYVHLYGQGQSRRGPAFKIPLSTLLEASCYPLVNRFMAHDVSELSPVTSPEPSQTEFESQGRQPQHRVDLYIPAPPGSDKQQAFNYHLATRNLFAFVFRRSLVGEHLGTALIGLLHSMYEFRTTDVDNLADIQNYMDEEGYLDFKSQPSHALACLHFAEVFQLRDLYIEAFAHCCGMSDRLFLGPEYQLVASVTRKLLRRARVDMDVRLGRACTMLRTFLQDELSETHLGLNPGARAHLERFRTLVHGFYAARFGYYPPPSIDPRTTIFEVEVIRTLQNDFEALFNYLVDESSDPTQGISPSAQGGICALQSVQSFDARQKFSTLEHPLPLLPDIRQQVPSKRINWFNRQAKASQSQRSEILTSVVKATNQADLGLLDNHLVQTYRKFEEDCVYSPLKADKQENLSLVDARKVRWILIYAVHQTIKYATQPPPEVKDFRDAPYNLCISTEHLPPWTEERPIQSLIRRDTEQITRNPSVSTAGRSIATDRQSSIQSSVVESPAFEIRPDIDYLGLSNHEDGAKDKITLAVQEHPNSTNLPRRTSFTRSLSRHSAVRRSLRLFGISQPEQPQPPSNQRKPIQYHEIVVHGYGNGTKDVEFTSQNHNDGDIANATGGGNKDTTTSRSPSTSSNSSSASDLSISEGGSASTEATSVNNSPVTASSRALPWETQDGGLYMRGRRGRDATPRPVSMYCTTSQIPDIPSRGDQTSKPRDRLRPPMFLGGERTSLEPAPLQTRKAPKFDHRPVSQGRSHSFMEAKDDIQVHWDSYTDLGGLTEMNNVTSKRASVAF